MKVKCPLCDFETDNAHTMFSHMINAHCDSGGYFVESTEESPVQQYTCFICGYVTNELEKVIEHIVRTHKIELKMMLRSEDEITRNAAINVLNLAKEMGLIEGGEYEEEEETGDTREGDNLVDGVDSTDDEQHTENGQDVQEDNEEDREDSE